MGMAASVGLTTGIFVALLSSTGKFDVVRVSITVTIIFKHIHTYISTHIDNYIPVPNLNPK